MTGSVMLLDLGNTKRIRCSHMFGVLQVSVGVNKIFCLEKAMA
jgi:hypothetical protein